MKKCLILGANGFIGKNLCAQLAEQYEIRAFDKFCAVQLRESGVKDIVEGDFLTKLDFCDVLEGVDTVYHLISTTLPKDGSEHIIDDEVYNNVVPTLRLLESMKKMGTQRIIFASSGGTIYGEYKDHPNRETDMPQPKCSYGLQKQLIEDCIKFYAVTSNIQVRIARISNPYGIGQLAGRMQGVIPIFIDRLLNNQEITLFGTHSHRDYIFMDDMIEALVCLGVYEGEHSVFNIASNEVCSLLEIVEIVENVVGKKFLGIIHQEQRKFDVDHVILDTSLAQKELGWKAKTSIKQGIMETYRRMVMLSH